MNNNRGWLFLIPFPAAILLTYAIWVVRFAIDGGMEDAVECTPMMIAWGLPLFPIGLAAAFSVSAEFLLRHAALIVTAGYSLYVALSIIGAVKHSRVLLLTLSVILLINVAGCHMPAVTAMQCP